MHLANPDALALIWLVVPVAGLLWWSHRRNARLARLVHRTGRTDRYVTLGALMIALVVSAALMAARPQIERQAPGGVPRRGDVLILVDVSRSMAARDGVDSPSALERAVTIARRLVLEVPEARFQLFGYAQLAFPLSTVSRNPAYLEDVLSNGLYVGVVPKPGSDLPNALALAARERQANPLLAGVVHAVLLSDGQYHENGTTSIVDAIALLREAPLAVTTVGIGSAGGERIPVLDVQGRAMESYERLGDGRVFVSVLQDRGLRQVARETGGRYFREQDATSLVTYIRSALPAAADDGGLERAVVGAQDVSWIPLIPFTLALALLIVKRHDLA